MGKYVWQVELVHQSEYPFGGGWFALDPTRLLPRLAYNFYSDDATGIHLLRKANDGSWSDSEIVPLSEQTTMLVMCVDSADRYRLLYSLADSYLRWKTEEGGSGVDTMYWETWDLDIGIGDDDGVHIAAMQQGYGFDDYAYMQGPWGGLGIVEAECVYSDQHSHKIGVAADGDWAMTFISRRDACLDTYPEGAVYDVRVAINGAITALSDANLEYPICWPGSGTQKVNGKWFTSWWLEDTQTLHLSCIDGGTVSERTLALGQSWPYWTTLVDENELWHVIYFDYANLCLRLAYETAPDVWVDSLIVDLSATYPSGYAFGIQAGWDAYKRPIGSFMAQNGYGNPIDMYCIYGRPSCFSTWRTLW